jgi:Domain of unknown function (DUF4352)
MQPEQPTEQPTEQPGVDQPAFNPTPTPTPTPVANLAPAAPFAPVAQPETASPFGTPPTGAPQPPKKSKKGLIIAAIAAGILLLAGIGAGVFALMSNNADGDKPATVAEAVKQAVSGNKEVIDRTDGTLDLSKSDDGKQEITAQDVTLKVNQQVNLSDGLSLMVAKVQRDFTGFDSKYVTVKDGNEVVAVTVVVGARSEEGARFSKSVLTMSAPSNEKISSTFASSLAKVENILSASSLDKNEQVSGVILYQVAKGEQPLTLNYAAPYKNYGSGETVTLKVKINL